MKIVTIPELIKSLEKEIQSTGEALEKAENLNRLKEVAKLYEGEDQIITTPEIVKKIGELEKQEKIMSGFSSLDKILKGFRFQQLVVVSALTKSGKCLGKGTEVLMFDGSLKKVEEIKIGDKLMGYDSTPRNVLALGYGTEKLFKIKQRGAEYVVNASHILSLKETGNSNFSRYKGKITSQRYSKGKILNISVRDFLESSDGIKHRFKGWKTGINFEEQKLILDPYFLGLWLGDGNTSNIGITTADKEIVDFLINFANEHEQVVTVRQQKDNKSKIYSLTSGIAGGGDYCLQSVLREIGVLNNKHIPHKYKINSRKNRLLLLAGLLDADGYLTKNKYPYYDYITKLPTLAKDIYFLASSLGFQVKIAKCKKGIKKTNFFGEYYRISISGDLSQIPVKILRKKSNFKPKKSFLTSKIEIEELGVGEYYGFELDGDGLFVLGNFVVTHNTSFIMELTSHWKEYSPLWFALEESIEELVTKFLERNEEPPFLCSPNVIMPISMDWIEKKIVESIAKHNTRIVLIDQLDFLIPFGTDNRADRIGDVMRSLKGLAKKWNILIFLVCHLQKTKMDIQPTLEDLKGSSSIGQEADTVIILWRETKRENKEVVITNNVNISIQANRRTGTTGNIKMVFDNGHFKEIDWTRTEEERKVDDEFETEW